MCLLLAVAVKPEKVQSSESEQWKFSCKVKAVSLLQRTYFKMHNFYFEHKLSVSVLCCHCYNFLYHSKTS